MPANELDRKRARKLGRVKLAKQTADNAIRSFHRAIADAVEAGASPQAVADEAGFSRQRVWQIAKHEKRLS